MSTLTRPIPLSSRTPPWTICVFAAYALTVAYLSSQHTVFRDEARALSLTRSADNPLDLVRTRLVDEGHPAVWYLLLWAASQVSANTVVLKVVAVLVALTFAGLFFFRSPFPLAHRILFLVGILPLHTYAVMARNYGISAVFLFLIASAYSRPRQSSPWVAGLCNALLANTNVYGAICAIGIMLLPWRFQVGSWRQQLRSRAIVVVLTALGGLALAYTIWPSRNNLMYPVQTIGSSEMPTVGGNKVGQALLSTCTDDMDWAACMITGKNLHAKFEKMGLLAWLRPIDVVGLVAIVLMLRTSAMRVAFLAAFLLAGVFSRLIYDAGERHIGVLTMFLLSLLWIQRAWDGPTHPRYWHCVLTMLFLALSAHAVMGTYIAYKKLRVPYSQSRSAGRFLASVDASTIVICEPDFFGDALLYYAPNDIFIIRENRFGSYVRLRASFERVLTLAEISAAAERVHEETGRPVLLALPVRAAKLEEYESRGAFGRRFQINADELQKFQERYKEVAAFDGEGSETYVFYELRNRPDGK